jgi:membrane protein YdbS with pleckstrin-like domain
VHFDTALNVVWCLLGAVALASAIRAGICRNTPNRSGAWLHIIGVALIVAALFPYISATDDLVRSEDLTNNQHTQDHSSGKKTPNDSLIRLYEALDTPLLSPACAFVMTFFAVWFVFLPVAKRARRIAPACAGRSPPLVLGF